MSKSVSEQEWRLKAQNFQDRIAANPYPVNLDHYRNILSKVTVGQSVLDVGAGNCYVRDVLPEGVHYFGIDPFPRNESVFACTAEQLNNGVNTMETVIMLAALDNTQNVELALNGLKRTATKNIVILSGIDVPHYPDALHTHRITRKDLTDVLGDPAQEIEISKNVYLFEFFV